MSLSLGARSPRSLPTLATLATLALATSFAFASMSCSGNDGGAIGEGAPAERGPASPAEGSSPAAPPGDRPAPGSSPSSPATTAACGAPTSAMHAAVCVSLRPEAIDLTADPAIDGKGTLWIAAYQSPLATAASLLAETFVGSANAPITMAALKDAVRLDGIPPGKVYIRAVLFDGAFTPGETPSAGWWMGGYDLTDGVEAAKLVAVTTQAGATAKLSLDLLLLRKLVVNVHRSPSVFPVGDGRGPLRAVAFATASLDTKTAIPFFGEAGATCGDLSGASSTALAGYVVGKGPYWIFALLDDFGVGGLGPEGSLISIAGTTPTAILLPPENKIAYAAGAPVVTATVELGTAVPRKTFAPDAVTCP